MTISIAATLPQEDSGRPPLVLVHGAANSSRVWTFWQQQLADQGWPSYAIDLRGHGHSPSEDISQTTMEDYAADVGRVLEELRRPAVVAGWSMGGLVAMMAAARDGWSACIALAPSTPSREVDASVQLRSGRVRAGGIWHHQLRPQRTAGHVRLGSGGAIARLIIP